MLHTYASYDVAKTRNLREAKDRRVAKTRKLREAKDRRGLSPKTRFTISMLVPLLIKGVNVSVLRFAQLSRFCDITNIRSKTIAGLVTQHYSEQVFRFQSLDKEATRGLCL